MSLPRPHPLEQLALKTSFSKLHCTCHCHAVAVYSFFLFERVLRLGRWSTGQPSTWRGAEAQQRRSVAPFGCQGGCCTQKRGTIINVWQSEEEGNKKKGNWKEMHKEVKKKPAQNSTSVSDLYRLPTEFNKQQLPTKWRRVSEWGRERGCVSTSRNIKKTKTTLIEARY